MKRQLLPIAIFFLCALSPLHAEEQTSVFRIIGLSAPERSADLEKAMKSVTDVQLEKLDFAKGEATFRFDMDKLFPENKGKPAPPADKIIARLNERVLNASNHSFNVTAPSALPADQQTKLEIKVGLLDCKACRYAAYSVIAKIEGVERANVVSQTSTATINLWIDATKTNLDALTAALKIANVPFPEK